MCRWRRSRTGTSVLAFIFEQRNSALVGGISLALSVIGTLITLLGLWLTFKAAERASAFARRTSEALVTLRDRISRHDAARELTQANYALSIARAHVANGAWIEISRRCEDAHQALQRINVELIRAGQPINVPKLEGLMRSLGKLVDRIDAANAEKGDYPDQERLLQTLRRHAELLGVILRIIEVDATK